MSTTAHAAHFRHSEAACYPEALFGGFTRRDGTIAFYSRIRSMLTPTSTVVDFGCGRGKSAEDSVRYRRDLCCLRGSCARVIGLDVDEAGRDNPLIDEFAQLTCNQWPVEDRSTDIVIADFVLEHLPYPRQFFSEAARALKPGGTLCIRTPNRYSYVALASQIIPNRHHGAVLSRVQDGRQTQDVFPTLYRCNTARRLKSEMRKAGFGPVAVVPWDSEPAYLAFSDVAYRIGVLAHAVMPPLFRSTLLSFGSAN